MCHEWCVTCCALCALWNVYGAHHLTCECTESYVCHTLFMHWKLCLLHIVDALKVMFVTHRLYWNLCLLHIVYTLKVMFVTHRRCTESYACYTSFMHWKLCLLHIVYALKVMFVTHHLCIESYVCYTSFMHYKLCLLHIVDALKVMFVMHCLYTESYVCYTLFMLRVLLLLCFPWVGFVLCSCCYVAIAVCMLLRAENSCLALYMEIPWRSFLTRACVFANGKIWISAV